jgi:hypothetical protein
VLLFGSLRGPVLPVLVDVQVRTGGAAQFDDTIGAGLRQIRSQVDAHFAQGRQVLALLSVHVPANLLSQLRLEPAWLRREGSPAFLVNGDQASAKSRKAARSRRSRHSETDIQNPAMPRSLLSGQLHPGM